MKSLPFVIPLLVLLIIFIISLSSSTSSFFFTAAADTCNLPCIPVCQNSGTCNSTNNRTGTDGQQYGTCDCPSGFFGEACENTGTVCTPNCLKFQPCELGACACAPYLSSAPLCNGYNCVNAPSGGTGKYNAVPLNSSGMCSSCAPGYSGAFCQMNESCEASFAGERFTYKGAVPISDEHITECRSTSLDLELGFGGKIDVLLDYKKPSTNSWQRSENAEENKIFVSFLRTATASKKREEFFFCTVSNCTNRYVSSNQGRNTVFSNIANYSEPAGSQALRGLLGIAGITTGGLFLVPAGYPRLVFLPIALIVTLVFVAITGGAGSSLNEESNRDTIQSVDILTAEPEVRGVMTCESTQCQCNPFGTSQPACDSVAISGLTSGITGRVEVECNNKTNQCLFTPQAVFNGQLSVNLDCKGRSCVKKDFNFSSSEFNAVENLVLPPEPDATGIAIGATISFLFLCLIIFVLVRHCLLRKDTQRLWEERYPHLVKYNKNSIEDSSSSSSNSNNNNKQDGGHKPNIEEIKNNMMMAGAAAASSNSKYAVMDGIEESNSHHAHQAIATNNSDSSFDDTFSLECRDIRYTVYLDDAIPVSPASSSASAFSLKQNQTSMSADGNTNNRDEQEQQQQEQEQELQQQTQQPEKANNNNNNNNNSDDGDNNTEMTKERKILKGINLKFENSRCGLVVGSSGHGKSTLLDILSNRNKSHKVEGQVLLDGVDVKQANSLYNRVLSYVADEDALLPTQTVLEALRFSADLRLPVHVPQHQKELLIQHTVDLFGLRQVANNIIGSQMTSTQGGLSHGERRRLNLAVLIMSFPRVLIADEPVSGLDSYNARIVCNVLKEISRGTLTKDLPYFAEAFPYRPIVVLSIHQPANDIFFSFDDVYFIGSGHMLYSGPVEGLEPFLESQGLMQGKKEHVNLADHCLEISCTIKDDSKLEQIAVNNLKKQSSSDPNIATTVVKNSPLESSLFATVDANMIFFPDFNEQVNLLLRRGWINLLRRPAVFSIHFLVATIVALVLSAMYSNSDKDVSGTLAKAGLVTFFLLWTALQNMSALDLVIAERPTYIFERASETYSTTAYFCSKIVLDFLLLRIIPVCMSCILFYFPTGFRPTMDGFGSFLLIAILFSVCTAGLSICVATFSSNFASGILLNTLFIIVFFAFGGLISQSSSVPASIDWLRYLSPFSFSFEAIMISDLKSQMCFFTIRGPSGDPIAAPLPIECVQFLFNIGLKPENLDFDIAMLAVWAILYLIFSYCCLHFIARGTR